MVRKKILFVDDEEDWRTVVAAALSGIGHEVLTAADASEAMHLTEGSSLGLIILDLDLAGESGLDLMKYLHHNHICAKARWKSWSMPFAEHFGIKPFGGINFRKCGACCPKLSHRRMAREYARPTVFGLGGTHGVTRPTWI